jgi:hypothetical protein
MTTKKEVSMTVNTTNRKKQNRTEAIPIRFTPAEKLAVKKVAGDQKDYPSTFLRRLILQHLDFTMNKEVAKLAG